MTYQLINLLSLLIMTMTNENLTKQMEECLLRDDDVVVNLEEKEEEVLLMETEEGSSKPEGPPLEKIKKKRKSRCGSAKMKARRQRARLAKEQGGDEGSDTDGQNQATAQALNSATPEPRSVIFPTPVGPTPQKRSGLIPKIRTNLNQTGRLDQTGPAAGAGPGDSRASKRGRSNATTPASAARPAKRAANQNAVRIENELLLAVCLADGRGRLSPTDMINVQIGLRSAVDNIDGPSNLKMGGVRNRNGVLVIVCHDAMTKLWVETEVGKLSEGKFTVMDWAPPALKCKATVWVRESSPPLSKEIFPKISKHNGGLDTTNWMLVRSVRSGAGFILFLRMDEASKKKVELPNRVYYY